MLRYGLWLLQEGPLPYRDVGIADQPTAPYVLGTIHPMPMDFGAATCGALRAKSPT